MLDQVCCEHFWTGHFPWYWWDRIMHTWDDSRQHQLFYWLILSWWSGRHDHSFFGNGLWESCILRKYLQEPWVLPDTGLANDAYQASNDNKAVKSSGSQSAYRFSKFPCCRSFRQLLIVCLRRVQVYGSIVASQHLYYQEIHAAMGYWYLLLNTVQIEENAWPWFLSFKRSTHRCLLRLMRISY